MICDPFFFLILSPKYAGFILKCLSFYLEMNIHFNFAPPINNRKIDFLFHLYTSHLKCSLLLSNRSLLSTALFRKWVVLFLCITCVFMISWALGVTTSFSFNQDVNLPLFWKLHKSIRKFWKINKLILSLEMCKAVSTFQMWLGIEAKKTALF